MTLGRPVEPLLQMPLIDGDTAGETGSPDWFWADTAIVARVRASRVTAGLMISSSLLRSHSGKSQRIGTGTAPAFQHPRLASTRSTEFGMASTM